MEKPNGLTDDERRIVMETRIFVTALARREQHLLVTLPHTAPSAAYLLRQAFDEAIHTTLSVHVESLHREPKCSRLPRIRRFATRMIPIPFIDTPRTRFKTGTLKTIRSPENLSFPHCVGLPVLLRRVTADLALGP